jgi:choline monooxygenase
MVDQSLFEDFDVPGEIRRGLPAEAYIGDDFMQVERDSLFSENWVFVGYAHQLERAGDVSPVEVAGLPLFLLRNQQNEIVSFHNICRHRNLKLIDVDSNCGKLIRCPYHSWSYDLCGTLKNAPYFGGAMRELPEDFSFAENGLLQVHCEVWHDWIFVNLAKQPTAFEDFLAPLKRQLGEVDVTEYLPQTIIDFGEVSCNWKLLMENFIEPYHVQFVHNKTTEQPLEDHYTVVDEHCVGSAVELDPEQEASAKAGTLGVTSHYLTLFPNFIMGTYQPDQMGVYLNQPIAPGCTRQFRVIYTHRDTNYSDDQINAMRELWKNVHREDHEMCVRLQQGRHSPFAAEGGWLSPKWENSVRKFQELVANAIRPQLTHRG